jgi:CubicO group peptidase (beta-lactamase class C family)
MVIGAVTGRPYGEEVQRRIVRPLGTTMPGAFCVHRRPTRARVFAASPTADAPPVDLTVMNPSMAGEIISTTADRGTAAASSALPQRCGAPTGTPLTARVISAQTQVLYAAFCPPVRPSRGT